MHYVFLIQTTVLFLLYCVIMAVVESIISTFLMKKSFHILCQLSMSELFLPCFTYEIFKHAGKLKTT